MSGLISESTDSETLLDFFVHNYSSFRPTQSSELLALGRGLIRAASTRTKGWANVGKPPSKAPGSTSIFRFNRPLIIPDGERGKDVQTIKEWGVSLENDDQNFTLGDLDDFISTDFTYLFVKKSPPSVVPSFQERSNLDLGPLHDVVPQPHIHPSLQDTPGKLIKILPYKRRKPTPIPPHIIPLPAPSSYARSAWLVPIRGSLPWDGCTSAVILNTPHSLPCPSQNQGDPITWTHVSLQSFWTFLLSLRTASNVGPIGLSFYASRSTLPQGSASHSTIWTIPGSGNQAVLESHAAGTRSSAATPAPGARPPLSGVDHVKLYHYAPNAMYLRNALHVWAYQADAPIEGGEKPEKIRLLKGARLALVDERSKGILIS